MFTGGPTILDTMPYETASTFMICMPPIYICWVWIMDGLPTRAVVDPIA